MASRMSEEQCRRAEQIVRRWQWASQLSVPADRAVEQSAVGALAIALLDQLLTEQRRVSVNHSVNRADAA